MSCGQQQWPTASASVLLFFTSGLLLAGAFAPWLTTSYAISLTSSASGSYVAVFSLFQFRGYKYSATDPQTYAGEAETLSVVFELFSKVNKQLGSLYAASYWVADDNNAAFGISMFFMVVGTITACAGALYGLVCCYLYDSRRPVLLCALLTFFCALTGAAIAGSELTAMQAVLGVYKGNDMTTGNGKTFLTTLDSAASTTALARALSFFKILSGKDGSVSASLGTGANCAIAACVLSFVALLLAAPPALFNACSPPDEARVLAEYKKRAVSDRERESGSTAVTIVSPVRVAADARVAAYRETLTARRDAAFSAASAAVVEPQAAIPPPPPPPLPPAYEEDMQRAPAEEVDVTDPFHNAAERELVDSLAAINFSLASSGSGAKNRSPSAYAYDERDHVAGVDVPTPTRRAHPRTPHATSFASPRQKASPAHVVQSQQRWPSPHAKW